MGRRKIQIAPIQDDRNRNVTFGKRRNGLFKKAYELGVLCQVDIAVLVWSHTGKLHVFTSAGQLQPVLDRYSSHDLSNVEVTNPRDTRCAGGNNEADHYFYYTEIGTCCGNGYDAAYRPAENSRMLASEQRAYNATGTAPVLSAPITAIPAPSTTAEASTTALANATSVLEGNATATPVATATAGVGALGANGQQAASTEAVQGAGSRLVVPGLAAVIAAIVAAIAL